MVARFRPFISPSRHAGKNSARSGFLALAVVFSPGCLVNQDFCASGDPFCNQGLGFLLLNHQITAGSDSAGSGGGAGSSCTLQTWTPRTSVEANNWRASTFGGGLFVAVASNGTVADQVMTSPCI